MTGGAVAALALSAAVLLPASPRRRLGAGAQPARRPSGRRRWPVAAGCAAGCATAAVAAMVPVTTAVAAAVLGATIALRRHRSTRRRRAVREAGALEGALDVLVGELRAGAHPVRAFDVAAAEADCPAVGGGLRAVAARARLGADVPTGLRGAARSASLPAQWERLAVYWQLGTEHGLPISTLLHAAQRDLAERQRFSASVYSGTAGARASAGILAGLPLLGLLLGQLIGARPLSFLFAGPGGGLLTAGVVLACAGLLWSDRIIGRLT